MNYEHRLNEYIKVGICKKPKYVPTINISIQLMLFVPLNARVPPNMKHCNILFKYTQHFNTLDGFDTFGGWNDDLSFDWKQFRVSTRLLFMMSAWRIVVECTCWPSCQCTHKKKVSKAEGSTWQMFLPLVLLRTCDNKFQHGKNSRSTSSTQFVVKILFRSWDYSAHAHSSFLTNATIIQLNVIM